MRILVVDDSEDARDIMAATLASGGYEDVSYAASGPEALETLGIGNGEAGEEVDVILLDIVMPEMDGIEVCALIRADGRYQDASIVMVTSLSDSGSLAQAFIAGANDYVTKPFNRVELLARIRSALRLKGELDRRRAREAELLNLNRELRLGRPAQEHAPVDAVTGLPDRRTIDAMLRAAGDGGLGIVALRIDSLTRFRNAKGEAEEAALMRRLALELRAVPGRLGDLLALYEEAVFVIFMREPTANDVRMIAQEALRRIEGLALPHGESRTAPFVTLSAGAVFGRAPGTDPRMLLADAVAAVERAAAEGGNRLVFSEEAVSA